MAEDEPPLLAGEFLVGAPVPARAWLPAPRCEPAAEAPPDEPQTWAEHIVHGVSGIYQKPLEGGRAGGVVGFAAGLGAGVLGLASHTLQGAARGVERAVLGHGAAAGAPLLPAAPATVAPIQPQARLCVTNFRVLWGPALALPLAAVDSLEAREDLLLLETKSAGLRVALRLPSAEAAAAAARSVLEAAEIEVPFRSEHAGSPPGASPPLDLDAEYARLGLAAGAWRLVDNADGQLSPTYPRRFAAPAAVDDAQLAAVAEHRSQRRLPAVVWRHPQSGATMARSAQPLVGLRGASSEADQALVAAIRAASGRPEKTFFFVDARGSLAAAGNQAAGKGVEDVGSYDDSVLFFCGIPNIHAVRASARALAELCHPAAACDPRWLARLDEAGWLRMVSLQLAAAARCAQLLAAGHSMLVHCSDGWDRTSQICSLVQITLDPFSRTLAGFAALVTKEWCSFGHQFATRYGHAQRINQGHEDERAPVFLQFLDAVWQIMRRQPSAFEFTERALEMLADAAEDCRFGDFCFDTERERLAPDAPPAASVWPVIAAEAANADFRPVDGPVEVRHAIRDLRLWEGHVRRWSPLE